MFLRRSFRRFHEAKLGSAPAVTVWGSGKPRREFLHVDDLADACVFVLKHYSDEGIVNIGTGEDVSIAEFAAMVAEAVGYKGEFVFDRSKPDGAPRKLLDVSKLRALGWRAGIDLKERLSPALTPISWRWAITCEVRQHTRSVRNAAE